MIQRPIVGIIGVGMVGGPLKRYFESAGFKRGKNLLCFDTDPRKKCNDDVSAATLLFICVPTPARANGSCDISLVEKIIATHASPRRLIIVKSTVEPMTCERLARQYRIPIFFNPEFLREAFAWGDMIRPDRQIVAPAVGGHSKTREVLKMLPAAPFSSPGKRTGAKTVAIRATEAEVGKYACNAFGSLKVAFANVVADLCSGVEMVLKQDGIRVPVDYDNVRAILAHDRRIGDAWLNIKHGNYRGYGGYCFPKDTNALMAAMRNVMRRLPDASNEKKLIAKGLKLFEAMRVYNQTLLESQGLTEKDVSRHDEELEKKLKVKTL